MQNSNDIDPDAVRLRHIEEYPDQHHHDHIGFETCCIGANGTLSPALIDAHWKYVP
jgi:hypothetical protein